MFIFWIVFVDFHCVNFSVKLFHSIFILDFNSMPLAYVKVLN